MKYKSLTEIYSNASPLDTQEGLQFQDDFNQAGNWRGMFDIRSYEWTISTLHQKVALCNRFMILVDCTFEEMVLLWLKDLASSEFYDQRTLISLIEAVDQLNVVFHPERQ